MYGITHARSREYQIIKINDHTSSARKAALCFSFPLSGHTRAVYYARENAHVVKNERKNYNPAALNSLSIDPRARDARAMTVSATSSPLCAPDGKDSVHVDASLPPPLGVCIIALAHARLSHRLRQLRSHTHTSLCSYETRAAIAFSTASTFDLFCDKS